MSKTYGVGLVVGKFAPLHNGHVLVVQRALALCARVLIISYSSPELPGYEAERREAWLKACFPTATVLVVTPERLATWLIGDPAPPIPTNDASDFAQREFVAMLCSRVLGGPVDVVFTSEDYGDGYAAHLTERFQANPNASAVRHVMVDRERRTVPISSTEVRRNPWQHWSYLPLPVARSLVRRIVFLGGESSGKTVLAARLAEELDTKCVPEYGRELWEARKGALVYEDLSLIAREQIRREETAIDVARAFVFCDTSPLTTLFYSLDMFGRAEPDLLLAAQRQYSLVVLCAPDFPFIQDGTRRDEAFRQHQTAWYQSQLVARGVSYVTAYGSLSQRTHCIRELLGV